MRNVNYVSRTGLLILKRLNLKLYESERVTIVCDHSSGKDFLISLIMMQIQASVLPGETFQMEIFGDVIVPSRVKALRSDMMYLFPESTLLSGTVRDNIDPSGISTDLELIRTLHFLKVVTKLQDYSKMVKCSDISLFLRSKTGDIQLSQIYLDDYRNDLETEHYFDSEPLLSAEDEKKSKGKNKPAGKDKKGKVSNKVKNIKTTSTPMKTEPATTDQSTGLGQGLVSFTMKKPKQQEFVETELRKILKIQPGEKELELKEVEEYFNEQNDQVKLPLPSRAKRIIDNLDDFDQDYAVCAG